MSNDEIKPEKNQGSNSGSNSDKPIKIIENDSEDHKPFPWKPNETKDNNKDGYK